MSDKATFLDNPWGKSQDAYVDSVFAMTPAPETATSEVLLASLYRAVGFDGHAETAVPRAGRDFLESSLKEDKSLKGHVASDTWRTVLNGVLNSPRQPNQSARRFLQLAPVIPDATLYSGSARLTGNSWNPGRLISSMIQLGSPDQEKASMLWDKLFEALSVTESDDIWARWLQEEFAVRRKIGANWEKSPIDESTLLDSSDKALIQYPAKQFVRDLSAIIDAKGSMTRRQWTTLVEAILRIGATTHVLWLCQINRRLWQLTKRIIERPDEVALSEARIKQEIFDDLGPVLAYGKQAAPAIRDLVSGYLASRAGINFVICALKDLQVPVEGMKSIHGITEFLRSVTAHRLALISSQVMTGFYDLLDRQAVTINCKKGIGKNIVDFVRYVLQKRQASDAAMRGYDQGYILMKRGSTDRSPWVVSMGPVAVLAMVHCCLAESRGPRSVGRFSVHMATFGIKVDLDDVSLGDLGRTMRMLGLVLDSPDAESGMLLVPPFIMNKKKEEN